MKDQMISKRSSLLKAEKLFNMVPKPFPDLFKSQKEIEIMESFFSITNHQNVFLFKLFYKMLSLNGFISNHWWNIENFNLLRYMRNPNKAILTLFS